MKVLIVANYNTGKFAPFIIEQVASLKALGIELDYFGVVGKGIYGYLKNGKKLIQKINQFQPNIIHAHYGLSGLLANLQRKIPVVTTYHGSDINYDTVYPFSKLCIYLSAFNIFVTEKNRAKTKQIKKQAVIPCGVDIDLFKPIDKQEARKVLKYMDDERLVLFAGAFQNKVKNASLAKQAINLLPNVQLIELSGYTRKQVALLMNAVDAVLMTSFTEGSPQFIKEAMACNCPIVSVNVGDVSEVISGVDNCYISTNSTKDIAENIQDYFEAKDRTNGRNKIIELGLDSETVAKKVYDIYQKIIACKE